MTLNPFKYFADERAKDREALLGALDRLFATQGRQADVAVEQARAMRSFMDLYLNLNGTPTRRVADDLTEYQAEEVRLQSHQNY